MMLIFFYILIKQTEAIRRGKKQEQKRECLYLCWMLLFHVWYLRSYHLVDVIVYFDRFYFYRTLSALVTKTITLASSRQNVYMLLTSYYPEHTILNINDCKKNIYILDFEEKFLCRIQMFYSKITIFPMKKKRKKDNDVRVINLESYLSLVDAVDFLYVISYSNFFVGRL